MAALLPPRALFRPSSPTPPAPLKVPIPLIFTTPGPAAQHSSPAPLQNPRLSDAEEQQFEQDSWPPAIHRVVFKWFHDSVVGVTLPLM